MSDNGKTPGQLRYEKFCQDEYSKTGRVWNTWEVLTPEDKGKWEAEALRWTSP